MELKITIKKEKDHITFQMKKITENKNNRQVNIKN